MKIEATNFGGEIPRESDLLLGNRFAQSAVDTDLRSGELRAFSSLLPVNTPTKSGTVNTIYRWAPEAGQDAKGQITAVANTTPVGITSAAHGHTTGYRVYIDGTGLSIDGATYVVTVTGTDTFTLGGSSAAGTASTGTQVRENGYWFHWASSEAAAGVEVSRLSLEDDTDDMVAYVGHEHPKLTYNAIAVTGGTDYPVDQVRLGLPVPTVLPTALVTGTGDGQITVHNWLYCFVSTVNGRIWLGPPSTATADYDVEGGQAVDVTLPTAVPAGWTDAGITHKRVFRYVADTTGVGGLYYRVGADVLLATATFTDTMGEFSEALLSTLYDPPPTDLHSIVLLPNGIMAGLSGNMVCFTPPEKPWAWPDDEDYRKPMESDGVGLEVYGSTLMAMTRTRPYRFQGGTPPNMRPTRLNAEQACTNKRSIIRWGNKGVAYASPDGLVLSAEATTVLTKSWLTRREWQALKPESIHGYFWDDRYVGFYDNGTTQGGFILDPAEGGSGLIFIDTYATHGYSDPLQDTLYLLVSGKVQAWNAGFTAQSFLWMSKNFLVPQTNFNVFKVVALSYTDLTLSVWADGVKKVNSVSVTSAEPFRPVPSGFTARQWWWEIQGTDTVVSVAMAETVSELAT